MLDKWYNAKEYKKTKTFLVYIIKLSLSPARQVIFLK